MSPWVEAIVSLTKDLVQVLRDLDAEEVMLVDGHEAKKQQVPA